LEGDKIPPSEAQFGFVGEGIGKKTRRPILKRNVLANLKRFRTDCAADDRNIGVGALNAPENRRPLPRSPPRRPQQPPFDA
jgi:hypothetical protein